MSTSSKGRAGGVLPISIATTKKATAPQKSTPRSPAPRLRLIIRRLPPGLTESEFWEALGDEWRSGGGKVDWFAFKAGKMSKDLSKPSRPSRVYLKVKDQSLLDILSIKVKQAQFRDAKNTATDPCLIGPPSLEFAPYNKVPGGRVRNDGRQGTIDQDQEFFDFLQSLTEPITKTMPADVENLESAPGKVTTTPLVQFIKEKKANKAKEKETAAAAKTIKKQETKEAKDTKDAKDAKSKPEPKATVIVKSITSAAEKARVAKATQEAVKAINKSVASMQPVKAPVTRADPKVKEATAKPTSQATAPTPVPTPAPKRERERGNASAAARMISRDLGLTPKEPRTPRTARNGAGAASTTTPAPTTPVVAPATAATTPKPAANPPKAESGPTSSAVNAQTAKTVNTTPTTPAARSSLPVTTPVGPRSDRAQAPQPKQTNVAAQRQAKPPPQPSSGSKSAFLKHANPSQGITEDLLRSTFSVYGEITRCEIDKKKGLGTVDFADPESLRKAMAASPVKIGNGQVTVLENRSPYRKGVAQQQKGNSDKAAASPQNHPNNSPAASTAATSIKAVPAPSTAPITPNAAPAAGTSTAAAMQSPAATKPIPPATTTSPALESIASAASTPGRGGRGGANAGNKGSKGPSSAVSNRGVANPKGGGRGNSRGRGGKGGGGGGNNHATMAANTTAAVLPATTNGSPAPAAAAQTAQSSTQTPASAK